MDTREGIPEPVRRAASGGSVHYRKGAFWSIFGHFDVSAERAKTRGFPGFSGVFGRREKPDKKGLKTRAPTRGANTPGALFSRGNRKAL
jgi:hypothetical protein